jgi:benzodiazapine receptor
MRAALREWIVLAGFLALCLAVAGLGAFFTGSSVGTWYLTLRKPSWTPPNWVFAPVWTVLYCMIAISGWMVWRSSGLRSRAVPLVLFAVQLLLNLVWSYLFFGLRSPMLGALDITVLWLTIAAFAVVTWNLARPASLLFIPYLAWVTYAGALNWAVWLMNSPAAQNS